ncbi:MAG TPA: histidinol-phosphate transaminase [Thermoleophilaceae bacterium]|nr:histidinol-phosphate transaminase [Thermoleophilaceae bacterium]
MTDWSEVLRPQLLDLGPYVPGPSVDDRKRKAGIGDVAKLNWNEGLFGPLPGVLDAVARELPETWSYPEHAYLELREGLAAETGTRPGQILPGHGIQSLILALCSAFLVPGDRVVVPQPTYGLYAQASRAAGAVVERVPSPELRLDLERIADAARRTGARLVWICDPNNPTGSAVGEAEWRVFLDALPPRCLVAADEAYADYIDPPRRIRREDDVAAGRPVVVLRTFSKLFGLAGLRVGYALAAPELVPYLQAVQEPFNVNRPALVAGAASLGRPADVDERRRATAAARDHLAAGLRVAGLEPLPSEANFLLVEHGADDDAVTDGLLRRGVLVRPGSELGLPGWARITVGPRPLMDRVTEALPAVLAEVSPARARAR